MTLFYTTLHIMLERVNIKNTAKNTGVNSVQSSVKESKTNIIKINKIDANSDSINQRSGYIKIGKHKVNIKEFLDPKGEVSYNKIKDYVYPRFDKLSNNIVFTTNLGDKISISDIGNIREKVYVSICSGIKRYIEGENIDINEVNLNRAFGSTYIEIDLSDNKLYVYIEEDLKLETSINITGVNSGVYAIDELNENMTVDNYFINREIILNDKVMMLNAVWELDGVYKNNTINVGGKNMKELFYWSFIGLPIVVY